MPDDIDELFPNLAPILRDWGNGPSAPMSGEQAQVTDEQIAEFVRQRMSQGQTVGPAPVIDGQPQRPPQFAAGSSGIAPKDAYMEGDDGSPTPGSIPSSTQASGPPETSPAPSAAPAVPTPAPTAQEPPIDESPLSAPAHQEPSAPAELGIPGDDVPPLAVPTDVVVGDTRIPQATIEQYAKFDAAMRNDPRWSRFVTDYLQSGQVPVEYVQAPPLQPGQPVPQPGQAPFAGPVGQQAQPFAPLPPLPAEYADDPVVTSLHSGLNAALVNLQNQQTEIARALMFQQQQQFQQQTASTDALVSRAASDFQSRHNLSTDEMERLERATADMNILPSFLGGKHPIHGTPLKPDTIAAVDAALDVAFHAIPEFRNKEMAAEIEQRRADQLKRQKLAGVSGSSGSVPRSQPAPVGEVATREALVSEVSAMLKGEWSEPGR